MRPCEADVSIQTLGSKARRKLQSLLQAKAEWLVQTPGPCTMAVAVLRLSLKVLHEQALYSKKHALCKHAT